MTDTNHRGRQAVLDYTIDEPTRTPTKGVWDSKDRRRFRRHPLGANTVLIANGARYPCVIEDVSVGGMQVSVDVELPVHTLVKFGDAKAGILKGKILRSGAGSAIIKINSDNGSSAYIFDLICGRPETTK